MSNVRNIVETTENTGRCCRAAAVYLVHGIIILVLHVYTNAALLSYTYFIGVYMNVVLRDTYLVSHLTFDVWHLRLYAAVCVFFPLFLRVISNSQRPHTARPVAVTMLRIYQSDKIVPVTTSIPGTGAVYTSTWCMTPGTWYILRSTWYVFAGSIV